MNDADQFILDHQAKLFDALLRARDATTNRDAAERNEWQKEINALATMLRTIYEKQKG